MIATPKTAEQRAKEARERKQKEAFQAGCAKLGTALLLMPLVAFTLMLAIGAVHGFAPAVPAIGYGTTILIVLGVDALALVTKPFRRK
ncbi:hypothetical protein ABZ445_16125 [Streptomyces chartreusis]|uniref:hypothetical protein n=1 Tax=Streptomyces chartreusis TaxID=1969 RepID=UPI0033C74744